MWTIIKTVHVSVQRVERVVVPPFVHFFVPYMLVFVYKIGTFVDAGCT